MLTVLLIAVAACLPYFCKTWLYHHSPPATIPALEQTRRRRGPPSAMETHVVCRAARIEDSWNADYEHHLNKELIMTQFNFDDLAWKFRSLGQNYQL